MVVRLPSLQPDSKNSSEVLLQRGNDTHRSVLAEPALVSANSETPSGSSIHVSDRCVSSISEEGSADPSRPSGLTLDSVDIVHERVKEAGVSERAADIAVLARRQSTSKTYNARLAKCSEWTDANSFDPMEASLDEVCSFFIHLFDSGRQVSTIRNYRSAIAAIHKGFQDGSTLSSNQVISKLLKGMLNKRTSFEKARSSLVNQ